MNENVPLANYEDQQYFLSESKWDWHGLMRHIATDASAALQDYGLVGCTVDEKAHLKKGKESAGATRQYAGIAGKVENCQVGVYLSLCADKYTTLSNHRLYLPREWCEDKERCRKAGIPEEAMVFKTKPQQALEMILEHKADGVHFDYVNGDGLYGNSYELSKGLEAEGIPYVLDIHSNQRIYLDKPTISVPAKKQGVRGRPPTRLRANRDNIEVREYVKSLQRSDFKEVKIRRTTKGWLKALVHVATVWVWDKESGDTEPTKQTLIYRKPLHKNDREKYSLSNIDKDSQSVALFAFMQGQRFWIEKTFRDNSHDLGMSDYQVRKWKGWHNHMAMTSLAMLFVLEQRLKYKDQLPLLSCNDVREVLISIFLHDGRNFDEKIKQMHKRHKQRANDTARYYKRE